MEPTRTILLADEDPITREFLADNLTADGYAVVVADDQRSALGKLAALQPDIVVCDVNGATLELVDAVRHGDGLASRIDAATPLIVLTARADELARVRFFDRGCDDVIAKPFCYSELRARIAAVLRRAYERQPGRVLRVGELEIDTPGREVRLAGELIELSAKEYALLVHVASDPTRVFTKEELLRSVWGFRTPGATRTLDAHVSRLRHKLASDGGTRFFENVWGVGYRLLAPARHAGPSAA